VQPRDDGSIRLVCRFDLADAEVEHCIEIVTAAAAGTSQ
jgi:hypothetical protein